MWLLNAEKVPISIKRTINLNCPYYLKDKNGKKLQIDPPKNSTLNDKLGLTILSSKHRVGLVRFNFIIILFTFLECKSSTN